MAFEMYTGAFERALARLVTAFGESPDFCFSQADLHAALSLRLLQSDVLSDLHITRDGRRTRLVHQQHAASSFQDRDPGDSRANPESYDVVLINPAFVRSSELDVVARHDPPPSSGRWVEEEQPLPLLAAANLVMVNNLGPANLDLIERRFFTLVHAERDALRAYMGIFLRQWELDEEAQEGLQLIESWAKQQPFVSVCCVQSYRDRAGHVFAGRYLNDWNHEAPLLPMELPVAQRAHPTVAVRTGVWELARLRQAL